MQPAIESLELTVRMRRAMTRTKDASIGRFQMRLDFFSLIQLTSERQSEKIARYLAPFGGQFNLRQAGLLED